MSKYFQSIKEIAKSHLSMSYSHLSQWKSAVFRSSMSEFGWAVKWVDISELTMMILVTVTLLTLVDCIKGLGYNPYAPARVTLLSMKTSQLMSEQFVMAEAGLVAVCELRVMIRRRDIEWTQVNCLLVNNMGSSSVSSAVEWGEVTHTWAFYYKIGDTVIVLLLVCFPLSCFSFRWRGVWDHCKDHLHSCH